MTANLYLIIMKIGTWGPQFVTQMFNYKISPMIELQHNFIVASQWQIMDYCTMALSLGSSYQNICCCPVITTRTNHDYSVVGISKKLIVTMHSLMCHTPQ